jgi:hypothetical protein
LIRWLERVCFILDSNVVLLLDAGNEIIERVTELGEEKIEDQETIIRLLSINAYNVQIRELRQSLSGVAPPTQLPLLSNGTSTFVLE